MRHQPGLERFRPLYQRVKYFIAAHYPGPPNPPPEEELRRLVQRQLGGDNEGHQSPL